MQAWRLNSISKQSIGLAHEVGYLLCRFSGKSKIFVVVVDSPLCTGRHPKSILTRTWKSRNGNNSLQSGWRLSSSHSSDHTDSFPFSPDQQDFSRPRRNYNSIYSIAYFNLACSPIMRKTLKFHCLRVSLTRHEKSAITSRRSSIQGLPVVGTWNFRLRFSLETFSIFAARRHA